MARFCKQCNRKFGFFEEDFDDEYSEFDDVRYNVHVPGVE